MRPPPSSPTIQPQTQDLAKKLKESGGLDLMGYIEFQRWVEGGGVGWGLSADRGLGRAACTGDASQTGSL